MADFSRNDIINYGIRKKYSADKINTALVKGGQNSLGPRERALIEEGMWGKSPLKRFGEGAMGTLQGINTIASIAGSALTDSNARNIMKDTMGQYLATRGLGGTLTDIGSMVGSPYGLTEENIKDKGLGKALLEAPFKAWAHPFEATLDIGLPLAGRIPAHSVGNALAKINGPQAIRSLISSSQVSKVNTAINTGRAGVMSLDRQMARQLNEAVAGVGKADMEQVARNLQVPEGGKWIGSEATLKATKKMAEISDTWNSKLVELGVDVDKAKEVSTLQYLMERLNPDRTRPVTLTGIRDALAGDKKILKALGTDIESINKLAKEAEGYFDQGIIKPLSHRATYAKDERFPGLVTREDRALNFLADRKYGKATPKELAPTLLRAYEDTAREITQANIGKVSMEGVARAVGKKAGLGDFANLLDDEIIISPRAFNDLISKDFSASRFNTVSKRIKDFATKGIDETLAKNYTNDLYRVSTKDIFPLINMANANRYRYPLLNKLNSGWKTAQLITPKYVIENRLGNWTLNALEGVTPMDYIEALGYRTAKGNYPYKGKYYDIKPEQLKADTSYYGVLGESFQGTTAHRAMKLSLDKIREGIKEKDIAKIGKGSYDLFSAPTLAIESGLEGVDRYANFIRQAKRMSSKTGESVENIIKRAGKDNALYSELMGDVNRSLGDYVGRNWAIDPQAYALASLAFPFFKYPTQGVRTLTHQAMQKPGNFFGKVTLPSRIGSGIWKQQVAQYPEIADERGGIVTDSTRGKYGRTILRQSDINPLGAGMGLISNALNNWEDIGISPFFSFANIAQHKDRYGNIASSPRYTTINRGREAVWNNPKGVPTRRAMERPDLIDRLGLAGGTLANMYAPPIIAWNRYIGPGLATALNKPFYPRYDTSMMGQVGDIRMPRGLQPIISGKTHTVGRRGLEPIRQQMFGLREVRVYPSQSTSTNSTRNYRSAIKKYKRYQIMKNLENNGGKK